MSSKGTLSRLTVMTLTVSGLVLALIVLPGQVAQAGDADDILPLSINATAPNLANVGRAGRGDSAFLEMRISRWTTDEERDALISVLKSSPSRAPGQCS